MTGDDEGPDGGELAVEVRRGSPTPEELAALIAVVSEAYASEVAAAVAEDEPPPSPWRRSQRAPHQRLRRDVAWGRFAG
ncbi:MAG: acyl-CoA carboxylase subunit epsilon [Microbacterium sp.]|uniref:acyl-CoA carboxylase subunit epsilon n=1 Tax=Microbacterium sp. TaxID=51671 RepID=UPI0039E5BA11